MPSPSPTTFQNETAEIAPVSGDLFVYAAPAPAFAQIPLEMPVTIITSGDSPYTALNTDQFIEADTTGGAIIVNLPSAVGLSGHMYQVKNTGVNLLTIVGTIDGAASLLVPLKWDAPIMISNDTQWLIR